MLCTLCTKRGILCIGSLKMTNACDACQQAHKKCLFVVQPFQPHGQRSSRPTLPHKDSFVVNDDESIPEQEWTLGPQTGRPEQLQTISPVPSSINLSTTPPRPPSNGHFTPLPLLVCVVSKLRGNRPQDQVGANEPSQTDEPPIPGPSPSSEPHEDILTRESEPEVAPTQSMEEPFACPTPPHSVITIEDMPVGSLLSFLLPLVFPLPPSAPKSPPRCQAPLIPMMKLSRNSLIYNRP
ncbi:hypothetical protein O181_106498 [Austropuccinia psidii MF-1]|uniref:Zn(2)-C6 fungal-type domain-containing protein n=1 Tax=Austropuccinia psidii MF-1 TaxID=1389203 RepID=A0A9Q3JP46_9BASI|nr:hypothetical protein [Austropuccinia psidii MF-1]